MHILDGDLPSEEARREKMRRLLLNLDKNRLSEYGRNEQALVLARDASRLTETHNQILIPCNALISTRPLSHPRGVHHRPSKLDIHIGENECRETLPVRRCAN